jgi:hypothetical protein
MIPWLIWWAPNERAPLSLWLDSPTFEELLSFQNICANYNDRIQKINAFL